MLYRIFSEYLEKWYKKEKKLALLIDGARQVGKTSIIREFGKKYYKDNFYEINFITLPSAKAIFSEDLSADVIISKLALLFKKSLIPHKTLIFFDEVQECPDVRTAIKFLVEDGRFDYIESGSLLGINYNNVKSYPVGYEEIKTMYPMNFYEFAVANNINKDTIDYLESCYTNKKQVSGFVHDELTKLFYYYIIVGGMPAVVQEFVNSKDMIKVINLQESIVSLYRQDIMKYSKDKGKIKAIFDEIPSELNRKNKRFVLSDLSKSARTERYESGFNWLNDSGVSLPCYNIDEVKQPIEINKKHNLFKLFLNDSGLLCSMCSSDIQYKIINGDTEINQGSIMENVFATQLKSSGFDLFYFDKAKIGEVDFIIENKGNLIPIEIKSGKDYKVHKSLDNLIGVKDYKIQNSIVFSKANIENEAPVTYYPFYMIMFLKKENMLGNIKFDVNLKNL